MPSVGQVRLSDSARGFLASIKEEFEMTSLDQAVRFTNSIVQQVREKRMLVITGGNPVVVVREGK